MYLLKSKIPTEISISEVLLTTSCGWFCPATNSSSGCLKFRRLDKSYGWLEFRWLDKSCGWFYPAADSSSGGWIRVAADSVLLLTRVPVAAYELRLTPNHGWLEVYRLDTSCSWLHSTADSSSGSWIRLKADSILRLTHVQAARYELQLILSCGWLEFYTLIYQLNLRTYSAKCIIFMVCFLPTDFSYHWSRLWLLFQEPWRSLKKLEEASRLSCDWF